MAVVGRSAVIVAAAAAGGQFLTFAAMPWLTRIYTPSEFGSYAAFVSLCGVFLAISCMRYDVAIGAAADHETDAMLTVAFVACLATALFVVVVASTPIGRQALHSAAVDAISLPLIGIAVVLCGAYQTATAVSIRHGHFLQSAVLRLLQPLVFVVAAVSLPWGLIDSHLAGFFVGVPVVLLAFARAGRSSVETLYRLFLRYRDFLTVSLPTSLLDSLSLALPIWFITANYSAADTGQYSLAQRLLAAPMVILAMAAGQVFLKRAGDVVRQGHSPRVLVRRTFGQLLALAIGLLMVVATVGSPLLHALLAKGWRTDTGFLLLSFVPAAVRSTVSPVTGVFVVRQRLRVAAVWQASYFVGTAGLFGALAGAVTLEKLLLFFCVTEVLFYGWYLWLADSVAA